MIIQLSKFGAVLSSRQIGRESLAAFKPSLKAVGPDEQVVLDFAGVVTLSPSWADEFITQLHKTYGARLRMVPTDNASVELSLRILKLHLDPPGEAGAKR